MHTTGILASVGLAGALSIFALNTDDRFWRTTGFLLVVLELAVVLLWLIAGART